MAQLVLENRNYNKMIKKAKRDHSRNRKLVRQSSTSSTSSADQKQAAGFVFIPSPLQGDEKKIWSLGEKIIFVILFYFLPLTYHDTHTHTLTQSLSLSLSLLCYFWPLITTYTLDTSLSVHTLTFYFAQLHVILPNFLIKIRTSLYHTNYLFFVFSLSLCVCVCPVYG